MGVWFKVYNFFYLTLEGAKVIVPIILYVCVC